MAEVNTGGGHEKGGKNKQKKQTLRVDFTPMVDMNMLLITFFMFCTSMQKPQTMEISMPDRETDILNNPSTTVRPERLTTIILAENDKVYYYFGEPDYENYASLVETDYTPNGLRQILLGRNAHIIRQIDELKAKKKDNPAFADEDFEEQISEIKRSNEAAVVVIKPMDDSSYRNMIDALDEMLICNVSKYAVADFLETDDFLLKNLLTQGQAAEGSAN